MDFGAVGGAAGSCGESDDADDAGNCTVVTTSPPGSPSYIPLHVVIDLSRKQDACQGYAATCVSVPQKGTLLHQIYSLPPLMPLSGEGCVDV